MSKYQIAQSQQNQFLNSISDDIEQTNEFSVNTLPKCQIIDDQELILSLPQEIANQITSTLKDNSLIQRSRAQNQILYTLRKKINESAENILNEVRNDPQMPEFFSYEGKRRSLISNTARKFNSIIAKVHRSHFMDEKKAQIGDLSLFISQKISRQPENSTHTKQITLCTRKILYLFEQMFVKRDYRRTCRSRYRLFKAKCNEVLLKGLNQTEQYRQICQSIRKEEFSDVLQDYGDQNLLEDQIMELYAQTLPEDLKFLPYLTNNLPIFKGQEQTETHFNFINQQIFSIYETLDKYFDQDQLESYYQQKYGEDWGENFFAKFTKNFNFDNICWCYCVIYTRSFSITLQHRYRSISEIELLIPYVDLLNHSFEPNCQWDYDAIDQCFYLVAIEPIQVGNELTICYSKNLSNFNYFSNYGFYPQNNEIAQEFSLEINIDSIFNASSEYLYNKRLAIAKWFSESLQNAQYMRKEMAETINRNPNGVFKVMLRNDNLEIRISQAITKILVYFYELRGKDMDQTQENLEYQTKYQTFLLVADYLNFKISKIKISKAKKHMQIENLLQKQKTNTSICLESYIKLLSDRIEMSEQYLKCLSSCSQRIICKLLMPNS